jgi:hypothetical protein
MNEVTAELAALSPKSQLIPDQLAFFDARSQKTSRIDSDNGSPNVK